ncbi:MAG: oligoendopeptidase F family protein, partial [Clostridia bacterium]|nr:oligoendopeptidase F family protein [Clostridia bacterium]
MAESIKRRNEIDPRWQWKLTDIYPTQDAWEADFQSIKEDVAAFAKYQGNVCVHAKAAVRDFFAIMRKLSKVGNYAFLIHDTDNGDPELQAIFDRSNTLMVQCSAAGSFLQPELLSMPADELEALANDADMADYSVFLHDLIRNKPHTLSATEERILAMTQEMAESPDNTFTMLTCVDMKFPTIHDEDGNEVELSEATYPAFIRSDNRKVRKEAFEALFNTYASFGNTISSTYAAHVKMDLFYTQLRKFPSSVEASLFADEIPLAVYDNLIAAMHDSFPALDAYLKLRKQAMKVDDVHLYDLYSSMVDDFHMDVPYEKAFEMVLEGLQPLGEDYLAVLKQAYTDGWIDVYPNLNKPSGAYSAGSVYDTHPYVLLNHNDNLSDTFTIAHELGHSMHSFYSNQNQPAPKSDYSL